MMKKIIFIILLIFGTSSAFGQVTLTLDQYNALNNQIDSLRTGWRQSQKENALIRETYSLKIDSLNSQFTVLSKKNTQLKSKQNKLQKQIKKLKEKRIINVALVDSLKSKIVQSKSKIDKLQVSTIQLKDSISAIRVQIHKEKKEQFNKGKEFVYKTISDSYRSLTFDEMIKTSSKGQVIRDLQIVQDLKLKQKLEDLVVYFSTKELLNHKYDTQNIQAALKRLKSVNENSQLLKKLMDNLSNYKLRNSGLKETIQKIIDIDNHFIANTEKDQKEKEARILSKFSWYFYNYQFENFKDYPYLSKIIINIMTKKHKDANANISGMLNKL